MVVGVMVRSVAIIGEYFSTAINLQTLTSVQKKQTTVHRTAVTTVDLTLAAAILAIVSIQMDLRVMTLMSVQRRQITVITTTATIMLVATLAAATPPGLDNTIMTLAMLSDVMVSEDYHRITVHMHPLCIIIICNCRHALVQQ